MLQLDRPDIKNTLNSLLLSLRKAIPPVHPEGHIFIASFAIVTAFLGWLHFNFLFALGIVLTLWCVAFFRDRPRFTPVDPDFIISPADGTVQSIAQMLPPVEMNLSDQPLTCVSIFMSVFDGHINRAPIAGRVGGIFYSPGVFLNAELDKASEDNERNALLIETPERKIGVVQIAGFLARRIACFVHEGDSLKAGERFGLIRFGSRVDVYMPDHARLLVTEGQKVIAGETILASFKAQDGLRQFEAQ
jgi:phosphatidylserine decarboxylase